MQKLIIGFCVLLMACSLAWAGGAVDAQAELVSTAKMQDWIRQLWEIGAQGTYGYRMPGTPASHKGAKYILEKFRSFGLGDAFVQAADAPLSMPEEWRLTIRGQGQEEAMPCYFVRYAAFTPPGGITASMIHVGLGSEEEFKAKDAADGLAGKIVVVDLVVLKSKPMPKMLFTLDNDNTLANTSTMKGVSENWPIANLAQSYALAGKYGAAGYVAILTFTVNDNNQFLHWYADGSLPALTISPNAGARLKELLEAGPVEASLLLTGENKTGPLSHVFASLPGRTEETIVVHTHHDGWAVNEASGVAVVLALAHYFAQLPQESRERGLQFVALDSHFGKRGKMPAYWDAMLPRVVAAVSIEMVAKHYTIEKGMYVDTGLTSPTVFGVKNANPRLFSFVRDAIVKHNLDRSGIVAAFFGDGNEYSVRGIPLVERIAHNAPQFTSDDTPDKVMADALQPTAAAFIDIIRGIDAIPAGLLK